MIYEKNTFYDDVFNKHWPLTYKQRWLLFNDLVAILSITIREKGKKMPIKISCI